MTASTFSSSEAATRDVLWKKVFLKNSQNSKNSQESNYGLRNFQEHLFYRAVFGKPQMNTLYLETLTLEVPFRYIISFSAA